MFQYQPFHTYETGYPDKHIIIRPDQFQTMMNFLEASPLLIFDTETTGLEWFKQAEICGMGLGGVDRSGQIACFYTPVRHQTGEDQLDLALVGPAFEKLLANSHTLKIAHNLKFDEHMVLREGWEVHGPRYDTMIAARLYDENRLMGLKYRAKTDLNREDANEWGEKVRLKLRALSKSRGMGITEYKATYGYAQVDATTLGTYGCFDIEYTGLLYYFYERDGVSTKYPRIWNTEMDLTGVLCGMEERGISVNVPYLHTLRTVLGGVRAGLDDVIKHTLGMPNINLGSDDELRDLLVGRMGLPLTKRTRKGKLAVDKEVLKMFSDSHPVLGKILEWGEVNTLLTNYTSTILDRLDGDNILHSDYLQVGTVTGRACVAADTILDTTMGTVCISKLDLTNNHNVGIVTHEARIQPIVGKYYKGQELMYLVTLDDGSTLECTKDHKILTPEGWRKLDDLKVGSQVCGSASISEASRTGAMFNCGGRGFCEDSSEGEINKNPSSTAIQYIRARVEHVNKVLSKKIRERIKDCPKLETCSAQIWQYVRGKTTRFKDIKNRIKGYVKAGYVYGGYCRKIKYECLVCEAQHRYLRIILKEKITNAVTGGGFRVFTKIRKALSGHYDISFGRELLRRSAQLLLSFVQSIYKSKRIALVYKRSGEIAQLLCGQENNSQRSHMLVVESGRNAVINGIINRKRTTYSGIHFLQNLQGRFWVSGNGVIGRSRWEFPPGKPKSKNERQKKSSTSQAGRLQSLTLFGQAGFRRSNGSSGYYQERVITGIEETRIQDVWDIQVREDHSYIAQGFINHNSATKPNFQNQPSDSDDRAIKYSGKKLEDGGIDPWSIRRAYVPRGSDRVWLFFDYSQIELRIMAFYSNDPVMVKAYLAGEDIHNRTSLEVFGTQEKSKRRLAKVINFGLCIAEGQEVLTKQSGLVPIEKVSEDHLLWDGVAWVSHDGLVCRGECEVITYDGVTATPDHMVYLEGGGRATLKYLVADDSSRRIAVGALEEQPITYSDNYRVATSGLYQLGSRRAWVYDLLNAGPRHRFTVAGKIVSNSYGMQPYGFARQTGVTPQEAEAYFAKFFERYSGISLFKHELYDRVIRAGGNFENRFGRPRRVPDMLSGDPREVRAAERKVISTLIQGTAAELTKESLVRIAAGIKEARLDAYIVATVHDEIQLDCHIDCMVEVSRLVKRCMESFPEFDPIPIVVDAEYTTQSWADKHKFLV